MHDLRRDQATLAGQVRGAHGDYWVRLELALPPVSACDCGRPLCRHAAALIQTYHARRLGVLDVARLLDRFLAQPRRAPLAAAALGEDLVAAMDLPLEDFQDIWALDPQRRLLALDAALRVAEDREALLEQALLAAEQDPGLQALLAGALAERPPSAASWPRLLRAAPQPLAGLIADLRPPDLGAAAVLAALWQAAAQGERDRLSRLAPHAVALSPHQAYAALSALHATYPELIGHLLAAARADGRLRRAVAALMREADALPPGGAARLEDAVAAWDGLPGRLAVQLRLRTAARTGGLPQLLAARRAALKEGLWALARPAALRRIRERPDGPVLETELLLADGDLDGAVRTAGRCRSSPVPERLVAEALRHVDPALARVHELRAQALAAALAAPPARTVGRSNGRAGRRPKQRR